MGAIGTWLGGAVVFLGAIVLITFWQFRRQPVKQGTEDFQQFALAYLKKRWKWTLTGVIAWLLWGAVAGLVALGLAKLAAEAYLRFESSSRVKRQWREGIAKQKSKWMSDLGATLEGRVATVNRMFDRKDKSLTFSRLHEFRYPNKGLLAFRISRNLAAMDTREREFLRIVELLHSVSDDKEEQWYTWAKFGLLWGNGRATVEAWYYSRNGQGQGDKVVDGINELMSAENASVDSVINNVLKRIEKAEQNPGHAGLGSVLSGIKGRLSGGTVWLTVEEIPQTIFAPNGDHPLSLGVLEDGPHMLTYSGEGSMITIAPPGAGKTQCNVFPNLLRWRGPAVVLDVKGEIYAGTSKWRAENVGPVYRFCPLDPARSHCYNPLTLVRAEPDYIWEDSRFLADMMIVPSSAAADPFWESRARDVLTAAIAYVCYFNPPDQRPMARVVDIVHGGKPWDEMLLGLKTALDVRAMVQQGTSLAGMNEKTRDSVLQTVQSNMSAWAGERIARATQRSDWTPLDLRNGKNPTVYICLRPSEVDSYASLLRVLIAQHIRTLTNELPPRGSAPVLFLLDELPRLRHMPPVEEAVEIGRQYGLRLWMFAQSLGQLENVYPNAQGMVGSCAVRIFMNPSAHDGLAEKLSEELGYRESPLDASRQKVVEATELAGPGFRDLQLVMAGSCKPARVKKAFAWQDQEIAKRMGSL